MSTAPVWTPKSVEFGKMHHLSESKKPESDSDDLRPLGS